MQSNFTKGPLLRFLAIFLVLTLILFILQNRMVTSGIDFVVILTGNAILFLATLVSFIMYKKAFQNNNPHSIVRLIYSGLLFKMVICLLAAVIYIVVSRPNVNRTALLGCFIIYIIYSYIEVRTLMQLSKQQKNG